MNLIFERPEAIRQYRQKRGLNQSLFWTAVGITQSGGSRYESGRKIPRSVQLLLHLAYAPEDSAIKMLRAVRAMPTDKEALPVKKDKAQLDAWLDTRTSKRAKPNPPPMAEAA
jgi:transcriptional regulator with XRE-family HTH domain